MEMNDYPFQNMQNGESMNNQQMPQAPSQQPETPDDMLYRIVYPEIYYRLLPYIMNICDQMDAMGYDTPNQEFMDSVAEGIYEDITRMYPELLEYSRNYEQQEEEAVPTVVNYSRRSTPRYYRRGFRRRGILRDLIDILLLSEFQRRRRRYY